MSIALILLALGLLIAGAWRGWSVLWLAPVLAAGTAVLAGAPTLAALTQVFMPAAGGFVTQFFLLFLLGAVFGRLMADTGSAEALAHGIARAVGPGRAITAVVLACAVLTWGGVSLFVVAFAAWPLAQALFARSGTAPELIPASIALGAFTFTMTALPGTPAIQNAIPMPHFGTDAFAAPVLGLVGAAVMALGGLAWLTFRARRGAVAAGPAPAAAPDAPLMLALLPMVTVIAGTWGIGALLPMLDTSYLAEVRFGATTLDRVQGLWSVIAALVLAVCLLLALGWRRLANPVDTLGKGAETALKPLFNTAVLVGFGAVIASLPGFAALRAGLEGLSGGDVLVSLALATNVLAGITGSASGGLSIALDTLGAGYLAQAQAQGIDPQVLHRIAAVATGGLDALPHNGAVVTLLGICGMTHRQAYPDIFVVACAIPLLALAVMIGLAGFGLV